MDKIQTLFELLENNIVEIPIVQRDYAQGRKDDHATLVRFNLLSDMKSAVLEETSALDLNFVYGKEVNGKFIPLDGQQRLTTLFLLHLFAFREQEEYSPLLHRFTYETRKSSRDFFEALINHRSEVLSSQDMVSSIIVDTEWFESEWENDPTVQSSLVVLDEIVEQFSAVDNLGERLIRNENKPLIFQFLKMEDLGMEDSLYIKLNARGKPLSEFENFKARLFSRLADICDDSDEAFKNNFIRSFDGEWTDFFWKEFRETFDESFLNFFRVLFMNNHIIDSSNNWANHFDFGKLQKELFINISDVLDAVRNENHPKIGALILEGSGKGSSYYDRLLFHAVTEYIKASDGVIGENFNSWIRVATNLILNSQIDSQISNTAALNGLNELSIHSSNIIEYLAIDGKINGFSNNQSKEEINKAKIIYNTPKYADSIYHAENNSYFTGTVRPALNFTYKNGIFDEGSFIGCWKKVNSLFDKDGPKYNHLLRQALLTYSDYTIGVGPYKTLCVNDAHEAGSTPSIKRLFSDFPDKVKELLDDLNMEENMEEQLNRIVLNSNVTQNDWRYCFIKYPRLFDKMSQAQLRIREIEERILIVPKISTSGYNLDLYLTALELELKSREIYCEQWQKGPGMWERIQLNINNGLKVYYDADTLKVFDEKEVCCEFTGISMIDDAVNYISLK